MAEPSRKPTVTLPSFRELWPEYSSQIPPPSSDPPNTNDAQFNREGTIHNPLPPSWGPTLRPYHLNAPLPEAARSSRGNAREHSTRGEPGIFPGAVFNPNNVLNTSPPPREALRRRFVCATCGKGFTRPSSLRQHHNSHTGEKPFECPFPGCGRRYTVKSNMKRHQSSHALQQPIVASSPSVVLDFSPYRDGSAGIHSPQNRLVAHAIPPGEEYVSQDQPKRAGGAGRNYRLPARA